MTSRCFSLVPSIFLFYPLAIFILFFYFCIHIFHIHKALLMHLCFPLLFAQLIYIYMYFFFFFSLIFLFAVCDQRLIDEKLTIL